MKQTLALIRFDLLMQVRERGTWLLLAATLLLAGLGLFEGQRFERNSLAARASALAQQQTAQQDATALARRYFANPAAPEFAGLLWYRTPVDIRGYAFREHVGYAVKPAIAGAALAIGQADLLPAYVRVKGESMESVRTAADIDHPGRLAAGRYDLLFFIIYLWPLPLLALCVSVLTQERETQRIRSLQLQGVSPARVLLAGVAGRATAATLLLLLGCTVMAGALGALPPTLDGWLALGRWSLVVLAYSAFWAAVALLLCGLCGNRMHAAFASFGAWLVFTIIIPGLLAAGVQMSAPLPNREYYIQAMRDAGDQVAADKLNSLARFYDSHPEWKPVRTSLEKVSSSVSRILRAQELERAMAGVEHTFDTARARRDALFERAILLSPVTLGYQALSRIAGNDQQRHQQFIAEVQQHQAVLRDFFQQAIQRAALADETSACATTCAGGYGFQDFAGVPRFTASAALATAPAIPPQSGMLLFWIMALAGAAWWKVSRR